MATYTVIQDIEAEDKFLGPLTLKQFIFGASAALFGYLSFFAITKGAYPLLIVFIPPALLGGFLAVPWSGEQSTEVWVLAKLRFAFKPRARVWDQAGLEELVSITAPKKIEKQLTNGLDQTEVQSRLKALADTIDSRGWAVKNATLPDNFMLTGDTSDRLVSAATLPKPVVDTESQVEDVLDDDTPVSANFDHLIEESSKEHRQDSLEMMDRVRKGEPARPVQEEIHFTPPSVAAGIQPVNPAEEAALSQQLRNRRSESDLANRHMQTVPVYPVSGARATTPSTTSVDEPDAKPQAEMTNTSDADIINLAQNNDWNIETIARQAKKSSGDDEVVVSLR